MASSFGVSNLQAGDEIVHLPMEHHANIVPWHFLRERRGAVLKLAPVHDDGRLIDAFLPLLGQSTKLVAVTHMSNVLGTINPGHRLSSSRTRGRPGLSTGQGAVHSRSMSRRSTRFLCLLRP